MTIRFAREFHWRKKEGEKGWENCISLERWLEARLTEWGLKEVPLIGGPPVPFEPSATEHGPNSKKRPKALEHPCRRLDERMFSVQRRTMANSKVGVWDSLVHHLSREELDPFREKNEIRRSRRKETFRRWNRCLIRVAWGCQRMRRCQARTLKLSSLINKNMSQK